MEWVHSEATNVISNTALCRRGWLWPFLSVPAQDRLEMSPSLANLIYACGIAGLFYLNRDNSARTSKALWLPVVYIWAVGSRPVSVWLGMAPAGTGDVQLDGSPIDAAFFAILLIAAICVLVHRGRRILTFLKANLPILMYFSFCLLSVCWSDFPGVAFKRWIKAIGDVVMILIVVTDGQPVAALSRLFSRIGFILVPLSLLFIKYYPSLGRGYDQWTGAQYNYGVTLNKNMLGVITFVLLLGAVWRTLALVRSDEVPPHRGRILLAQVTLLALGIYLLSITNSVTSNVCFAIGTGLILATSLRFMRRHAAAVHVLVLLLLVTSSLVMLLGGGDSAAKALGRNSNLTGRTEIWAAVIPLAPNPLIGAGFESFWLSQTVHQRLWEAIPGLPLNEAHDGYIEVYLELGWVGVGLIGLLLIDGYRRSVKAFRRAPALGGLMIAYILASMVYSLTEAGFRMLDPIWIFFLLALIGASATAAGIPVATSRPTDIPADGTPSCQPGSPRDEYRRLNLASK
jgi:exopolysaccharide production protein ExoQ